MREVMLCHIGSQQIGIDIAHVKAVHRAADVSFSESDLSSNRDASKVCRLDDEKTDLFELHHLFGCGSPGDDAGDRKIMTVQFAGRQVGFCVDQVERVIETEEEKIVPLPSAFKKKAARWFPTVLVRGERLLPLLNPQSAVDADAAKQKKSSPPDRQLTAWGESMISGQWLADQMLRSIRKGLSRSVDNEIRRIKTHRSSLRQMQHETGASSPDGLEKKHQAGRVLIFRAGARYRGKPVSFLFSLNQICEIIPGLPLFTIPFSPPHVYGIVRWRQYIAPVISLETCLGFQTSATSQSPRLMAVRPLKEDHIVMIVLNRATRIIPLPAAHPIAGSSLGLRDRHVVRGVFGWDEGFLVAPHIGNIADAC